MLDTKTISIFEGILNKELSENSITIQDGFVSNGKDWLGDKPRCNYALVVFEIIYDKNVRDLFHLGSAVFSDGYSIRPIWRLQHYKIDTKMGI
jgi:hypothetical protein|tara:strand:- start:55 stop:333 length:279 start_codon:yes stop_codon:yes gene_type:complete